jgi:MoxR-like ATPase
MMLSHTVKDFCIIGPRGCGKNLLAERLAALLGYDVEPVQLYQDMTARDLLQQRTTKENGDTVWRY